MSIPTLTSIRNKTFRKGSFAANVLTLMTGTTLSQVLTFAVAPVLTRLYTPQDFGILALFISISAFLVLLASWRYEMAILLPKDHEDAAKVFSLSVFIVLLMTGLSIIMVIVFRHSVATFLKTPYMATLLWWIPIYIFLQGFVQIFNYWHSRMKNFSLLSASRIIGAAAGAGTQIGMGIWGQDGSTGLIAGQLANSFLTAGMLGSLVLIKDLKFFENSISRKYILDQARLYYRFPLIENWTVVVYLASEKLPNIIINYFFNNIIVGLYSVGYKVLNLPLQFIQGSLSQVFFQRYDEKRKSYGKKDFLVKIIKLLTFISIFPSVLLFFFAPFFFKIYLGTQWRVAGEYIRILTPALFFRFISAPTSHVLWLEGKNILRLCIYITLLIISISSFMIGGLIGNINTALMIFSIFTSILYFTQIILVLKVASS